MCSKQCPGIKKHHGHTEIECTILQECKSASFFNCDDLEDLRSHFQAIGKSSTYKTTLNKKVRRPSFA